MTNSKNKRFDHIRMFGFEESCTVRNKRKL